MRIALVSQEYPPDTAHGGIATQTWAKAHGFAERGHDVHVVSASADGRRREGIESGIAVTRLGWADAGYEPSSEPTRWLAHSMAVAAELRRLDALRPIDVVDVPEYGAEGYVHLVDGTGHRHIPTVVHVHGPLAMLSAELGWPEHGSTLHRVGSHMEGECLRLADRVISSSRHSAGWCLLAYGLETDEWSVGHVGVDTAIFSPPGSRPQGPPTILYVGRLAASKGVADLVAACRGLAETWPELRVRLAGRGDPATVADLVARAGTGVRLDLLGQLRPEELAEELRAAHLLAAPSPCEGGPGFVALEAMACGLPVVACSGTGVAEVIEHGRTGLLVPPESVGALAGALAGLLDDPGARDDMGRAAREWVLAHAERGACLDHLLDVYASVASGVRS